MPIPTPESGWKRFWKTSIPHDVGTAIAGSGSAAAAAVRFFTSNPPSPGWGTVIAGGAALGLMIQLHKARRTYAQQKQKDGVHDLAGCLHTLNAILLGSEDNSSAGLRSTVHVPDGSGQLVQALDYVGDQRKKKTKGRKMPIYCGVVGRACRERAAFSGSRTTDVHDDFINQMISTYGFDKEGAQRLDPSTKAWMASPLVASNGDVEGVLYLDAKQSAFFTDERQQAVAFASVGIAFFVGLRYS
jgi:hypothetical protein